MTKPFPHPSDLLGVDKDKIFKFYNSLVSCQYFFTEIVHANKGTIDMRHIKQHFNSKAWVGSPGLTQGLGRAKIQLFQNMVMLHIK